jgi:hypothetical protein
MMELWFRKGAWPWAQELVFDKKKGSLGYKRDGVTDEWEDGVYCLDKMVLLYH